MNDKLINNFLEACIKYGEAIEKGDSKNADKQSDIVKKIRLKLKGNKEYFIKNFEPLLYHENNYVKLKTAFSLLPVLTGKAEQVL